MSSFVNRGAAGRIDWKSVAANEGRVRIEAAVVYRGIFGTTAGKWSATYRGASPLPESSTAAIKAYGSGAEGSDMVSAELKLP